MHWLAQQATELQARALTYQQARVHSPQTASEARRRLFDALREVVDELARREGVIASFVQHEGLLMEGVGDRQELEAAAAMAQLLLPPIAQVRKTLSLGEVQQLVLVGEERKLVLLILPEICLGLIAPADVRLSERLS